MNMGFDIEEIRSFVMLGENGSFTETAHLLGISQSAVSQRIARLEQACGLQLFARTAERVSLTREGEAFMQSARRCVHEHHLMVAHMGRFCRTTQGRVQLWVDGSLLSEKLMRLCATDPPAGVVIDCVGAVDGQEWSTQLQEFECDLAVVGRFLAGADENPLFEKLPLCQEAGMTAIWSMAHYPLDEAAFDMAQVLKVPLILASKRLMPGLRAFVEDWCRRVYGTAPREVIEFDTVAAVLNACRAGLGVCLIPGDTLATLDLQSHGLVGKRLFVDVLPMAYSCTLHLRSDEINPQVMEAAKWVQRVSSM